MKKRFQELSKKNITNQIQKQALKNQIKQKTRHYNTKL